jgi:hypothetical protein
MKRSSSWFVPALILLAVVTPGNAQDTCTKASIAGRYGFTISGAVVNSDGSFYSVAESGTVTADGNGKLTGTDTNSQGGQIQSQTFTGTYTVNSDCTGTVSTADSAGPSHFNIVIVDNGQEILFIESDAGVAVSGSAKPQATKCTSETISGPYGYAITGWTFDSSGAGWGFSESGKVIADGAGGLSLHATASQEGKVTTGSSSGNYSVNSDCTGTATFNSNSAHLHFVVVASGHQIQFIQTDANTTITGSAEQVFPQQPNVTVTGGSMAQVASGGGWQTTFTLVNTGSSSAQAQLNFFDNNGNALSLPLTFVQSGTNTTAVSINQTVAPGDELLILTSGSNTGASVVGSAQLTTDGSVGGFAIFRFNPTGQEAVVPVETRNARAYVLAFDNTNGLATGLALANVSNQPANVPIVLRDDTGANLGTATIDLAAHGHTSFVLSTRYASVAGKRGTMEFDTPAGGQISVLGLRATPGGAVTTIPVLAK